MCLAVPARVLSISGNDELMRVGRVDFGGVFKEVSLAFAPEARVGDHVLVHVGFAIAVLDEAAARRVLDELSALDELAAAQADLASQAS